MTEGLITVGCDLGDRKSDFCFLGSDGVVLQRTRCATTKSGFRKGLKGHEGLRVIIEVGTHSRWVSEYLETLGHEVVVANPRSVQLISRSNRKRDVKDAELLARLGRADIALLSPIKHRGESSQTQLAVIKARRSLLDARTGLINHARGIVKSFGERLPRCSTATFVKKLEEKIPENLRVALGPILESIDQLTQQIRKLDAEIDSMAADNPIVTALTTIIGIGRLTALTYVLTLEDPHRFRTSRTVGAYIGLTPSQRQSGDQDPHLGITHAGDEYLRGLLVNCAHYILGPLNRTDSDIRRWGLGLIERGGKAAKKKAIIAVARKLSVTMHRIWISGEVYQPLGHQPLSARTKTSFADPVAA